MKIEFKDMTAKDYPILKKYFKLRPIKCCEGQFQSQLIYRNFYNTKYTIYNESVLFLQQIEGSYASMIPLCKKKDLNKSFLNLQNYFNIELNEKLKIYLADEEAIKILDLDENKYVVEELTDYYDYIYDAEKIRTLSGKKYHKKKNHLNAFKKIYAGRYEYKKLNKTDINDILIFLDRWEENKESDDDLNRLENERIGIVELLENFDILNPRIAGIYIDGKLEAFTSGSYNKAYDMAFVHLEKANSNIRGLYQFINMQFILNEFPEAVLVNREDDMGLPSLRKAKQSYNPIDMVKKYKITQI